MHLASCFAGFCPFNPCTAKGLTARLFVLILKMALVLKVLLLPRCHAAQEDSPASAGNFIKRLTEFSESAPFTKGLRSILGKAATCHAGVYMNRPSCHFHLRAQMKELACGTDKRQSSSKVPVLYRRMLAGPVEMPENHTPVRQRRAV